MSLEIKACPFCGGEATYQPDHTTECRDSIWCIRCDFGMSDPDEQGSVITAWNRRALAPADAQDALASRINVANEEGRIAGLREAAEAAEVDRQRDSVLRLMSEAPVIHQST